MDTNLNYLFDSLNNQLCQLREGGGEGLIILDSVMLRRLSYMVNRGRMQEMRKKFSERKENLRTRAVNLRSKAQNSSYYPKFKKYLKYAPIPIALYLLYNFINHNYSTKWRCIKKLDSIYNESNRDRLKINLNYKFIEYFFPKEPLAVIYPQSEEELEKVVQLCGQYNVGLFISSQSQFVEPANIEDHEHYIIVNPTLLKKFSIDVENHTMKIGAGLKCSEINEILKGQGYEELFDKELADKHLFEVINYNLPVGTNNLASILINLELISGHGKLFQSGPDIEHFGPNVRYNDLFLGSKGIFGIPLKAFIRLKHSQQSTETKTMKLNVGNPNDQILLIRQIINRISHLNIKLKVHYNKGQTYLTFTNYGQPILQQLTQKYPIKEIKQQLSKPTYFAMFNVPLTFLYQIIVRSEYSDITFQFQRGLLKVQSPEGLIKQLNNQVTIENGLLIWIADNVMFEELKKQNAGIELGENLIYENLNLREFFDPKYTLLATKSYLKFIKQPKRYTFRKMISSFW